MGGEVVFSDLYEDVLRRKQELQKKCDELLVKNSRLQTDLESVKEQHAKLHTTLRLGTRIERLEDLMRPSTMTRDEWMDVPRVEKWTQFFSNEEMQYAYNDLVDCILPLFSSDAVKAAKEMRKLYGVLNARVHMYYNNEPISTTSFRESV